MSAAEPPDTGGLLQISDPHFGTEQPAAVQALQRLVARRRPALVVLSGDITQRATTEQFAAARRFVQGLGSVPLLAVPGNHDIPLFALWQRLMHPYARYAAAFGPAVDAGYADAQWHVQALNTTRPWRHKNGEVSLRQAAACAARLRQAGPLALKVVVTHQPVAVLLEEDRGNRLRGADLALGLWHAAGAELVLGGHIHREGVLPLRPAPRPMWAVQSGTAVSTRVRPGVPNGVTELLALPGPPRACRVRFWQWRPGAAEFQLHQECLLPLA